MAATERALLCVPRQEECWLVSGGKSLLTETILSLTAPLLTSSAVERRLCSVRLFRSVVESAA
jgi:hypothetical protein